MSIYDQGYKKHQIDWSRYPGPNPAKQKKAQGNSDFLRFLGEMAPVAGAGLGTVAGGIAGGLLGAGNPLAIGAGAGIGGTLGGSLGQMAGGGLNYAADEQTQPFDEEEMKREARLRAALQFFGGRGMGGGGSYGGGGF